MADDKKETVYYEDSATHNLSHHGDVVIEWRSGNRPLTVKSIFTCSWCPVTRNDIIDVPTWNLRYSSYDYPPGVRVERTTAAERRKKRFLERTNLPADVVQKLRGEG